MIEVELKARIDDLKGVEAKLSMLGATFVKYTSERDVYFNHPCRDFSSTDEALRVRFAEGKLTLTYKGPKLSSQSKTREELSVDISSPEVLDILKALGFREVTEVKKTRRIYKLGHAIIYLDEVENLGSFIEFEAAPGVFSSVEEAEHYLMNIAEKLGIPERNFTRKSYLELLLDLS